MKERRVQKIEMVPIDEICVVNPRVRNQRVFQEIADNIASVGLKRPITLTAHNGTEGFKYDLVCGQGRLEAFRALGQELVPALVVSADADDCLIASLVENCARRQHPAVDMLDDISRLKAKGVTNHEIARRTGLSYDYVQDVAHLLEKGEHRLIRSVEAGTIPLSVATDIASTPDTDLQEVLATAYEKGVLRGRKLLVARRVVEQRKRLGKRMLPRDQRTDTLSVEALVKAFQDDSERKRAIVARTEATRSKLLFIVEALKCLWDDDLFLEILEDENLTTLPENLARRLTKAELA